MTTSYKDSVTDVNESSEQGLWDESYFIQMVPNLTKFCSIDTLLT